MSEMVRRLDTRIILDDDHPGPFALQIGEAGMGLPQDWRAKRGQIFLHPGNKENRSQC